MGKIPSGVRTPTFFQYSHHKELPRIIEPEGWLPINRLYCPVLTHSFPDLLMGLENTETSPAELSTIGPILFWPSHSDFSFSPHTLRV